MLGPFATASRRHIVIHQVSLLLHAATVARCLRIDVHDNNDDDDNAWQRGPLWPHRMGPMTYLLAQLGKKSKTLLILMKQEIEGDNGLSAGGRLKGTSKDCQRPTAAPDEWMNEWDRGCQWHQSRHVQITLLQTDNYTRTIPLSLTGQPTVSKHWRHQSHVLLTSMKYLKLVCWKKVKWTVCVLERWYWHDVWWTV